MKPDHSKQKKSLDDKKNKSFSDAKSEKGKEASSEKATFNRLERLNGPIL